MEPNTLRRQMIDRWRSPGRPLFKGKLISEDGCCCAQGDVLRVCGMPDTELRNLAQVNADREVAAKLGIGVAHAILLRQQNDRADGCPQDVLDIENGGIQKVLGPHANLVLAFWFHLDSMTPAVWAAVWAAAGAAVWAAAGAAAWAAAGDAAWASNELQGWSHLKTEPYFLKFFGIADADTWVSSIDPTAKRGSAIAASKEATNGR